MDDGLKMNDRLKKDDGLKVPNFKSKSQIKFTSVNNETPRKITSSNGKKKYVLGTIAAVTVITILGKSVIFHHTHNQVEHSGDYYSDGVLIHTHDLDEECFIRDYKFLNPKATNEDILNAFKNGEYEDYRDKSGGYININKSLQDDSIKQDVEYYNEDCVNFSDNYLACEEIIKNQR